VSQPVVSTDRGAWVTVSDPWFGPCNHVGFWEYQSGITPAEAPNRWRVCGNCMTVQVFHPAPSTQEKP
jgi:allophanate hydrolase subunit 1